MGRTLSDGALRQWIDKLTVVHVPPGTPLFRAGELVTVAAVVVKGQLRRHEGNSMDTVVVGTCSEGDVIGTSAMLDDHFHLPMRHVCAVFPTPAGDHGDTSGEEAVVVLWAVECVQVKRTNTTENTHLSYLPHKRNVTTVSRFH